MVAVNFQLKTTSKLQDISNALNAEAGKQLLNNIDKIKPIIKNTINNVIEDSKGDFIPDTIEAAELGVGENGSIDTSRISNAWKTLLVQDDGSGATTFALLKGTFSGRGRQSNLAELIINIDEEKLYKSSLSNIAVQPSENPQAEQISNIPWMRWFIEGKTISDFKIVFGGPKIKELSRTGEAIMIKGGIWSIPSKFNLYRRILTDTQRQLSINIKKNIGKVL